MTTWYAVKVKYTKQLEDGRLKRVNEAYLFNAMSFTDAEARAYNEIGEFVKGEFIITNITKTDFADIFHYEDCDTWYKVKMSYLSASADGEEDKEKKITQTLLVNAPNARDAYDRTQESMKGMLASFDIPSIALSPLVDVFPFNEEYAAPHPATAIDEVVYQAPHNVTAGVFSASGSDDDEDVEGVVENEMDQEEE
jgi:hypothetical protein